jgi:hypothetical protein
MSGTLPPHPHLSTRQLMAVARAALSPERLAYLEEMEAQHAGRVPPPPASLAEALRQAARAARRAARGRPELAIVLQMAEAALALLPVAVRAVPPVRVEPAGQDIARQMDLWEACR